tara:strand:- start:675 stop:1367 length:693 start_codon:yes stop_codon:yes gene_type:complete
MINKDDIEIFVPTLNEEGNIRNTIKGIKENGFHNITILDGNSSDKTMQFAQSLNCKVRLESEKKYQNFGGAIISAINNSQSKYCCVFDGDGSFDPSSLNIMVDKMNQNYDFVFCSRYLGGQVSEDDTLITKIGNIFFTSFVRLFFKINTTDVLFLYFMTKTDNLKTINCKMFDFRICIEILVKAYRSFNCVEIFSYEKKRLFGESKVNKFLDGFKLLTYLIELRLNLKKK